MTDIDLVLYYKIFSILRLLYIFLLVLSKSNLYSISYDDYFLDIGILPGDQNKQKIVNNLQ